MSGEEITIVERFALGRSRPMAVSDCSCGYMCWGTCIYWTDGGNEFCECSCECYQFPDAKKKPGKKARDSHPTTSRKLTLKTIVSLRCRKSTPENIARLLTKKGLTVAVPGSAFTAKPVTKLLKNVRVSDVIRETGLVLLTKSQADSLRKRG
jgi:hypothetical protein